MVVIRKVAKFIFFFHLYFLSTTTLASQIYDYQTKKFIEQLNTDILSVNEYDKKIIFKIINDNFPNAFVTQDNTLFISSGLLIHCPDYVALLAVLAHEIGHLEKYHVVKRINEIDGLKNKNSLGNLVAIAGSMIMKQPEILNSIILNQTAINNFYINFTQEQEIEADIYSINTLDKLNLPKSSIRKFLEILEDKTQFDLIDIEIKKFSTHPLFKERYEIIDSTEKNLSNNFKKNYDDQFKFIQAKFMAYTDNDLYELKGDYKKYYEAINYSKSGKLIDSLKKINLLISKYRNKIFLIETKADILLSYGYNKEAINFYKKVIEKQPLNTYAKYNIFVNVDFKNNKLDLNQEYFLKNLNLLELFPYDLMLVNNYYNLSKLLQYKDWMVFFEILQSRKSNIKENLIKLKIETQDINLKKIIKLYI